MLQHLKFLTAGESHGKGLSGILEGFPAGVPLFHIPAGLCPNLTRGLTACI